MAVIITMIMITTEVMEAAVVVDAIIGIIITDIIDKIKLDHICELKHQIDIILET